MLSTPAVSVEAPVSRQRVELKTVVTKKKFTFGIAIVALIVFFLGGIAMFSNKKISPENVVIKSVTKEGEGVLVKGSLTDSAIGYKGYDVSKEGENVYIVINGNKSIFGQKDGSFHFVILKDTIGEFREIYLKKGTIERKIWPE